MTTAIPSLPAGERNRRESFRIDDRVGLALRPLSEREYRAARSEAPARLERLRALNGIVAAGEAQRGALRAIGDEDPAIGAYLRGLEERLETLARLLARDVHGAPAHPSHAVNLSGNGIRFRHQRAIARGTRVALDLTLCPEGICLGLLATVVRCEAVEPLASDATARFLVAVDFTDIQEHERELLIRHVHGRQIASARRGVLRRPG